MTPADIDDLNNEINAADTVAALINGHLPDLIAYCRERMISRPQLEEIVKQFQIAESEEWLREAISLYSMCMKSCWPAVEWHDEVGGLNFAAGLSVADANAYLSIIRNGALELVWQACENGSLSKEQVPAVTRVVLRAFDCAMSAQAEAYVRESKRHLSEANRRLEFRQQMVERDLALAEVVQRKFIPQNHTSHNFHAEVRYVPTTSVGGDHAGIFPIAENRIFITICDVTGHGVASALVAEVVNSQIRPMLRRQFDTTFEYGVEPLELVTTLNRLFCREFQPIGILLSFFAAVIDVTEGTITYSGAGHPPPILQRKDEQDCVELRSQNIIIGADDNCVVGSGQDTLPIHRGDRVVFYTDGIIEATDRRGHMLGLRGLSDIVERAHDTLTPELADTILDTARAVSQTEESDDMSLIILDVLG
jgi:serine phosphatase RsbU (regulator of sigma subunit)